MQDGDKLGRVRVGGTEVDCDLYWGDTGSQFDLGAGCHSADGCVLPGENGTVFIGAHTGTFFSDLGSTEIGAIIHLETDWGSFAYKVTDMQVIRETDIDKVALGRYGAKLHPVHLLSLWHPDPHPAALRRLRRPSHRGRVRRGAGDEIIVNIKSSTAKHNLDCTAFCIWCGQQDLNLHVEDTGP